MKLHSVVFPQGKAAPANQPVVFLKFKTNARMATQHLCPRCQELHLTLYKHVVLLNFATRNHKMPPSLNIEIDQRISMFSWHLPLAASFLSFKTFFKSSPTVCLANQKALLSLLNPPKAFTAQSLRVVSVIFLAVAAQASASFLKFIYFSIRLWTPKRNGHWFTAAERLLPIPWDSSLRTPAAISSIPGTVPCS